MRIDIVTLFPGMVEPVRESVMELMLMLTATAGFGGPDIASRSPKKVKALSYPYNIARYGEEMLMLAASKGGKKSPSYLPNYYNWTTAQCAGPYILKWDGDTIATDALAPALERFRQAISKPHGIIVLTGPTGSGKSTTLLASLRAVMDPGLNIITVEDPVEYQQPGISQIQVHPKIGLTFAHCLRSILRHDPDVILIGEIRDAETAQIAVQSSLTGHLVFSTLHTNDAPGALTRLVDMGVEPYLVASSLEAVLAQRLVRILCPRCKQEDTSPATRALKAQLEFPAEVVIFKAAGCRECRQTGYHGRRAIFEWMDSNNEIRQMILKNCSSDQLREVARRAGMRTLAEDGWRLVRLGVTTPEEVLRVTKDQSMSSGGEESVEPVLAVPTP
jgi:Tfp pilus assembly pilus retraction ATPase PilT